MKARAYSAGGEVRKKGVDLPASTFDGVVNEAALHQVVVSLQAHARQGTASTRTRQEMRGGGRKPWRQKGTGRARQGSVRSPLWRGGAVVFGPKPRAYDPKIPRKLKRLAIRSALNARALEGNVVAVEPLELERPRTREVAALLNALEADGRNVLLLTDGLRPTVHLSARNLPGVLVKPWGEASAYEILWSDLVVVESTALERAGSDAAAAAEEAESAAGPAGDADAGEEA